MIGCSQSVPVERGWQVHGCVIDLERAANMWGSGSARAVDDRCRVEPDIAAVRKAQTLTARLDDVLDARFGQTPGGPTHFERETRSVKTVWNAACAEAGVVGSTPKTLCHTMLTWRARRGAPKEQRMALAGHAAQDTTARNYEHLSPDYLVAAIREVDAFFEALSEHTSAHLRYANDTLGIASLAD